MDYRTKGVCSQSIHFDIEDNKIHNVSFVGGCNGNLQGISHLVEGMDVDEAISRLEGIQCIYLIIWYAFFLFIYSCISGQCA